MDRHRVSREWLRHAGDAPKRAERVIHPHRFGRCPGPPRSRSCCPPGRTRPQSRRGRGQSCSGRGVQVIMKRPLLSARANCSLPLHASTTVPAAGAPVSSRTYPKTRAGNRPIAKSASCPAARWTTDGVVNRTSEDGGSAASTLWMPELTRCNTNRPSAPVIAPGRPSIRTTTPAIGDASLPNVPAAASSRTTRPSIAPR